jgi:hypothetical protein
LTPYQAVLSVNVSDPAVEQGRVVLAARSITAPPQAGR